MKITVKLVLIVLLSTAVILSIDAYLRVQSNVEAFQANIVQDLLTLGQVLGQVLEDAWRTEGQPRVLQLLADANASANQTSFRWLSLVSTPDTANPLGLDQHQIAALQRGDMISVTAHSGNGQTTLSMYVPVILAGQPPRVLELSKSLTRVQDYVRRTILRTIVVWLILVGLSGCLLLLIGIVMIGRPMRRVIEKTRRVAAGDLEGPLRFRAHDEFTEVATALNQMCEQLQASQSAVRVEMEARLHTLDQLRHADRLKTVGILASGIAHELGTPLNVVAGRASLILAGRFLAPPEITDSARIIKEQVQRMTAIIRQLLDFARRKTPQRVTVDLRSLIRLTLDMLMPLATEHQAVPTLRVDDDPVVSHVDTGQMQQVLMNLVTNAWQSMAEGGQITISVQRTTTHPPPGLDLPSGRYACVTITDQGKGIAPADLPHVFDPFFTTKDVGQGTGLGLSIAYGIVRDHRGWIEVNSQLGAGACFAVYLPMEDVTCPDAS